MDSRDLKENEMSEAIEDTSVAFKERIDYDRLSFYYISLPVMLITHMLAALLLSALQMNAVDLYPIGIWLLLNFIMFLYRFYHYTLFKKESETQKLKQSDIWLDRYYTNVLVSGIIWGSAAFLMFPDNLYNQMILLLFLFAIGFSSLGILAAKRDLLLSYVLVMFGPLLLRLFFIEGQIYTNIAYTVMSLVLIMILIANYYGSVINNALNNRQHFVEIKHSHDKLKERFFSLFERAPVGIYYYNEALELQDINTQFMQMNQVDKKETLRGSSLHDLDNSQIITAHEDVFNGKSGNYRGPFRILGTKEEDIYVDLSTVPMFNSDGEIAGGISIVNDITTEVSAQEKMMRSAYYDMLTNIPNRTLIMDKLKKLIENKKSIEHYAALLFLDIDNFKRFNETFGHDLGDEVLKQTAYRIEESIGSHETLARISGDKFLILIPEVDTSTFEAEESILRYLALINENFSKPLKVVGKDYHLSFTTGIVLFTDSTDASAFDLLKRSETAMYEAKKNTRGSIKFYHDSMSADSKEELMLENDIHHAIKNDEFVMHYQPQLDIETNEIIGAEALIRWTHPTKGSIPPDAFIPLAEESGIIVKLEEWIFDRILSDAKEFSESMGGFTLKHIAINVSTIHFLEPHFVEKLMLLVNKHQVKPEWFELEITESGMMRNIEDAIQKIKELKNFGFAFSIDDFGTGYSSLAYLKELPVDVIKIDQSFINNMNEDDAMIVEAVIAIGQKFNLEVLAEGVEDKDVLKRLKNIKCDTYQGYLAHKPMAMEDLKKIL